MYDLYAWRIKRHNEIRDLEAEILEAVCTDVEMEPVLQEVTCMLEVLPRGTNKAPDARLDIRVLCFWARQQSVFFDLRVCHPNADSYMNGAHSHPTTRTTGGMSDECQRYHSRLA